MISLFRKIRKDLLGSHTIKKYIFYAIGEILLVVIGILIALQVNNWNQDRQKRLQEIELLESFRTELHSHSDRIDEIVVFNNEVLKASKELIDMLESKTPYNSRMDTLFYISTTFTFGDQFSSPSLDNLKSVGVDIITNKDLRNDLLVVYDKYSYFREAQDIYVDIIVDAGKGILSTRFKELWKGDYKSYMTKGEMQPVNYNLLLDDNEYLYFLRTIPNNLEWFVFKPCTYVKTDIKKVLELIDQELKSLK